MKRREQQPQQVEKREARGTIREVVAARQGERSVVVCVCGRCVVGGAQRSAKRSATERTLLRQSAFRERGANSSWCGGRVYPIGVWVPVCVQSRRWRMAAKESKYLFFFFFLEEEEVVVSAEEEEEAAEEKAAADGDDAEAPPPPGPSLNPPAPPMLPLPFPLATKDWRCELPVSKDAAKESKMAAASSSASFFFASFASLSR